MADINGHGWRDEVVTRLKELVLGGHLSFTKITLRINTEFMVHYSRNAIMGKAHRLGVKQPPNFMRNPKGPSELREPKLCPVQIAVPSKRARQRTLIAPPENRKTIKLPAPTAVPLDPSLYRSLIELPDNGCHWPVDNGVYCGHVVTRNRAEYCDTHLALKRKV